MYNKKYNVDVASAGNVLYAMDKNELNSLMTNLNNVDFSDWIPYLFTDFSQFLISIRAYPMNLANVVPQDPSIVRVGYREVPNTTGRQFRESQTLSVWTSLSRTHIELLQPAELKWMSLDPYVSVELYLPFNGYHRIDVNAIMDKYLSVEYCIDFLTGMCTSYLWAYDDDSTESVGRVVFQTEFQMGVDAPFTSDGEGLRKRQTLSNGINGILGVISGAVSGGSSGGSAGAVIGAVSGAVSGSMDVLKAGAPFVLTGGSYSGSWNRTIEDFIPHLVIAYKQPVDYSVDTFKKYRGTKVFKPVEDLTDCYGYTQVFDVHLEGFGTATAEELDSIRNLLASGIILPESEPTPEPEPEYTITICDLDGTVLTSYSPALDVESVSLAFGGPGWPSLTLNFVDNTSHLLPFYPSNIDLSSAQPFQGLALIPGGISTDVVIPWGAENMTYTIDSDVTFYVVSR